MALDVDVWHTLPGLHRLMTESEEEVIAAEARRIESDSLYISQANFYAATAFGRLRLLLGLPAVIFAALAGTAIVASWSTVLAGICALIATIAATADLFVGSEQRSVDHHSQGVEYRNLQHDARRLRTLAPFSQSIEFRRARLEELVRRQVDLNRLNRPTSWAFKKGRRTIDSGDALQPGDEDLV